MDRFEAMGLMVATARHGSFSAVSRELGVPVATISRKIAELEAHVGGRLLTRSTRKMTLTEAGVTYIAACKQILRQVEEAELAASSECRAPRGELIVTAPIVFGRSHMLPIVTEFMRSYPEVDVRLLLADHVVSLTEAQVDLAARIGVLADSSMVATRVGSSRRVVCGSPDYFAAHGRPQTPDDLMHHVCVTFGSLAAGPSWSFRSAGGGRSERPHPRSRLMISTAEAAIDAAVAGVGLTHVLFYQVAKLVDEGKLDIVLRDFEPDPIPINLVYPSRELLPLKVKHFLELAVPTLRNALLAEEVKLATRGQRAPAPRHAHG
jgi:DNA-binding transcriptional LysR family regulator